MHSIAEKRSCHLNISVSTVIDIASVMRVFNLVVVIKHAVLNTVGTTGHGTRRKRFSMRKMFLVDHCASILVDQNVMMIVQSDTAAAEGFKIL